MSRILLINPGHDDEHEAYKHRSLQVVHRDPPPIGLLFVGTYLVENGYDVDILDTHVTSDYQEVLAGMLEKNDYIFVGFTIIIGKFLKNAKELTDLVRKLRPDIPIVWGGIMSSIMPEECLQTYQANYIVRFEGEETALELARALEQDMDLEEIVGLTYRKGTTIITNPPRTPKKNLDEFPFPRWELFGDNFNRDQVPYYHLIMSSKGCPFNCTFCYKHSVDTGIRTRISPWRARSASHIIDEIEYIHDKCGTRVFTFGDDNFIVKKNRCLEILAHFRKRGFYVEECIGHLNCLSDDLLDAMAGIVQKFIFSIETASPRLQKLINKRINLKTIPQKVQQLYDRGIVCNASFMIGLPSETDNDLRMNVELMLRLKQIHPFIRGNIYLYLPLPKTKLYEITERICGVELPKRITEFEQANAWVKTVTDPFGHKFRPWLDDERFAFLVRFGVVFNEVFKMCNLEFEEETHTLLRTDPKIKAMFEGVENVNHPKMEYRPYVLDMVLQGKSIDLGNSLKNM